MRKKSMSPPITSRPAGEDVAKTLGDSSAPTPVETAKQDMRSIIDRHVDELAQAYSKLTLSA
jgi:hypothetical protein